MKEKTRSRALADELEVPMNVHRYPHIHMVLHVDFSKIDRILILPYILTVRTSLIINCRWRILESSDPKRYEKVLQVQQLQKQLIEFSDKVTQIDLLIQVERGREIQNIHFPVFIFAFLFYFDSFMYM